MAPRGLPGSAVLAAAVFVGGAVSSPLVRSGECPVAAGARRRARGIRTAAPAEPQLPWSWHSRGILALSIWLSRGWPGSGAARGDGSRPFLPARSAPAFSLLCC